MKIQLSYRFIFYNFIMAIIIALLPMKNFAQNNKGINFQGIARDNNGYVLSNKLLNIRISIKADTNTTKNEYQEIAPITTNILGLFSVVVGALETNKIITVGPFENINWSKGEKYLQIEIDTVGDLSFTSLGYQKINYVPYSFYADNVGAQNINGVIGISQGGTGLDNLKDVKILFNIDKINNTPDSTKPISNVALAAINEKLKKADIAVIVIHVIMQQDVFRKDIGAQKSLMHIVICLFQMDLEAIVMLSMIVKIYYLSQNKINIPNQNNTSRDMINILESLHEED